jgi:hypothetical protein
MGEQVNIVRKIYGKNTFANVINVQFSQLVPKESSTIPKEPSTVETFFTDYDTLFYDIPPSGSDSSHIELVKRSSEYIGINIEDLEEEIRNLRDENVSLKTKIASLTNLNK